jgi:hypothetical protein
MLTDAELREALGTPEPEPNGIEEALKKVPVLNEEQPVLDLENLSWGDSKRIPTMQIEINKAILTQDQAEVLRIMGELEVLLCRLIISIPNSWLVRGSPANLDWTKPESLNNLKRDKFAELVLLVSRGNQEVADKAKN